MTGAVPQGAAFFAFGGAGGWGAAGVKEMRDAVTKGDRLHFGTNNERHVCPGQQPVTEWDLQKKRGCIARRRGGRRAVAFALAAAHLPAMMKE
jgi:hypothetical protein